MRNKSGIKMTSQNNRAALPTTTQAQEEVAHLEQQLPEQQQKQENFSSADWGSGIDISQIIELGSDVIEWVGDTLSDINIDL